MSFLRHSVLAATVFLLAGIILQAQTGTYYVTDFTKNSNIFTNLNQQFPNTGAGTPGTGKGVPNASFLFNPATYTSPNAIAGSDYARNGVSFLLTSDSSGHDFWEGTGPLTIPVNLSGMTAVYMLVGAHNYVVTPNTLRVTFTALDGTTQVFSNVVTPYFWDTSNTAIDSQSASISEQTAFLVHDVGAGGTGDSATGGNSDYELTELTFILNTSFIGKSLKSITFEDSSTQAFLLAVTAKGSALYSQAPFGAIDTPANGASEAGAVGVTGWALSSPAVTTVGIWRAPVTGETPSSNGLIFLVNASIIPGVRPDVAAAYPGYPDNTSGYGAQILSNELPNSDGSAGLGNGTYYLHVIATSSIGESTDLGTRSITVNNAGSPLPFGTIDTPTQGGMASGTAFVNFGWALTPQPNIIELDGSTINVFIDSKLVGHPVYDNYRVDIATLFPGLLNSGGAVGYYKIDTTQLTNGLHTISWSVRDSAGHTQGIGSRFFNVQN